MVIAGASCTLDVATTILDCIQLQAHMYVSNSSNQCRQAAALCNQAEDWGVYTGDLVIQHACAQFGCVPD